MEFEWDEAKRASNLLKHRLDFMQAVLVFDGRHVVESAREMAGETRFKAIGRIGEDHVALIFTPRGTAIRIISLRRARDGERRQYQALFGG